MENLTKTELQILINDLDWFLGESPKNKKEEAMWNKRLKIINKLEKIAKK